MLLETSPCRHHVETHHLSCRKAFSVSAKSITLHMHKPFFYILHKIFCCQASACLLSCIAYFAIMQKTYWCHAETATGEMSSSSSSIPPAPGSTPSTAFARPPSPPQAGMQPPSPPQSSAGAASDAFGSSNSLAGTTGDGWHDNDDDADIQVSPCMQTFPT